MWGPNICQLANQWQDRHGIVMLAANAVTEKSPSSAVIPNTGFLPINFDCNEPRGTDIWGVVFSVLSPPQAP